MFSDKLRKLAHEVRDARLVTADTITEVRQVLDKAIKDPDARCELNSQELSTLETAISIYEGMRIDKLVGPESERTSSKKIALNPDQVVKTLDGLIDSAKEHLSKPDDPKAEEEHFEWCNNPNTETSLKQVQNVFEQYIDWMHK